MIDEVALDKVREETDCYGVTRRFSESLIGLKVNVSSTEEPRYETIVEIYLDLGTFWAYTSKENAFTIGNRLRLALK